MNTDTHRWGRLYTWMRPRATRYDWLIVLGMLAGLVIFYRASYQVPITALGLAIFFPLALWRPDLALLFVPLTVPLAFMPKGIWDERFGIRSDGVRFPLHEIVLLITVGSVGLRWLYGIVRKPSSPSILLPTGEGGAKAPRPFSHFLPHIVFLLAGTAAVLTALPEGRGAALREWRWLIVEPLLFYAMVRWCDDADSDATTRRRDDATTRRRDESDSDPTGQHPDRADSDATTRPPDHPMTRTSSQHCPHPRFVAPLLAVAFVVGGVLVGLVGVLQYWGLNVAPLIGDEVGFSDDVMFVEGVLRATSVYGHPNNLALYMGRVWPVACVLALAAWDMRRVWLASIAAAACLVCIGGLYVAFSKGAQYGALAALLVLVVAQTVVAWRSGADRAHIARRVVPLAALLVVFVVMIGSGLRVERLNVMGASSHVRVKTWLSALEMVRDHPLAGLGLDQFNHYYREYIDPSLRDTTEWYISHPHNLVLDVWLRMGIAGVLAFGWLLGGLYAGVWRGLAPVPGEDLNRKERKDRTAEQGDEHAVLSGMPADDARWAMALRVGAAAAMTAAVVHGLVDNFYFVPDLAFAFWLLLAWGE